MDHLRILLSPPENWKAVVTKVHDADTVTVDIDLGAYSARVDQDLSFHLHVQAHHLHIHQSVRLYGINAAELTTTQGKTARDALQAKLPIGSKVQLTTWADRNDKYGRILGVVMLGKTEINQWLIDNGHAASWDGTGTRPVPQ